MIGALYSKSTCANYQPVLRVNRRRSLIQTASDRTKGKAATILAKTERPTQFHVSYPETTVVNKESVATASFMVQENLDPAVYGEHAAAFLSGNFTPIQQECTAELGMCEQQLSSAQQKLQIEGSIPVDFPAGQFAYVGPNPKFAREHYKKWGEGPGQRASSLGNGWHHWFEGDGMIYVLNFDKSRSIVYRNRYIRTDSWKLESMLQRRVFRPLMNADGSTFLFNAACNFAETGSFLKDSANTALFYHAGRMMSLQDTQEPWEVDSVTLKTLGRCTFDGTLPSNLPFTAHPKIAPVNGDMIFFGFNPVSPPHCTVGAVSSTGSVRSLKPVWTSVIGSVFMHDFVVTRRYTILFEGSMDIEPIRQVFGQHPLQYNKKRVARFGLLSRDEIDSKHSDAIWYACSSAQSVFHFVNAWEELDEYNELIIVVVGIREDGFFHNSLRALGTREWIKSAILARTPVPRLHEWRIKPTKGIVQEKFLFEDIIETPRINDKYCGNKNRYAYAGKIHTDSLVGDAQLKFNGVIKFDLQQGTKEIYEHQNGVYGMEPQFVARQGSASEDDGWLIMYAHDESNEIMATSYCIIFDAKQIMNGPIVQIPLPERVPYGAHALWLPSSNQNTTRTSYSGCQPKAVNSPRKYAFRKEQVRELISAVTVGLARGASGLFLNGWRPTVRKDSSYCYSFIRFLGFRLSEYGETGTLRKSESDIELSTGIHASPSLVLYDIEGNCACKVVREAISMLDICCLVKPCPHGAVRHRAEALSHALNQGGAALEFPVLFDITTNQVFSGAASVLDQLYSVHLDGALPPWYLDSRLAKIAFYLGGVKETESCYASPTKAPATPLNLWAYEASPFCTIVREKLCEMEIPYVLFPCARGSSRRDLLQRTAGTFQVPYLEDPNTSICLFESADIVEYLEIHYSDR